MSQNKPIWKHPVFAYAIASVLGVVAWITSQRNISSPTNQTSSSEVRDVNTSIELNHGLPKKTKEEEINR